ncbi:MAG: LuxR C-terminal-related transcriptional regulator [Cyanobacteria bacterium J06623_7]
MTDLQLLFKEIDRITNESELRSHLAPQIGKYFTATRSGVFFFDRLVSDSRFKNTLKTALSVEHNPVARYLAERHAPVHEEMVTSPKAWNLICPRPDHWHVMAGPIVNRGQLVGVVGCTREKSMSAFGTENLADLSAICLHLSVWSATVRSAQHNNLITLLTPRELEIVELVAKGKTNAEIGRELWITINSVKQALKRIFRKLEVSSRAEMVAKLFAIGHYSLAEK